MEEKLFLLFNGGRKETCCKMSVSETLKTRNGIKRFILPASAESEVVFAFEYTDKRTEIHLLKQECTPLYLEENTKVALLNCDQIGVYLLAVTPSTKQGKNGCLLFRAWDSASVLGFTPKEIQIIEEKRMVTQDGKFRCLLNLSENLAHQSVIMIDSLGSMVALHIENEVLIWKAIKTDPGIVSLKLYNCIKLNTSHPPLDIILLQLNGEYSISVFENGSFSVWNLNDSGVLIAKTISITPRSQGCFSKPHRITNSKFVFVDDVGKILAFSLEGYCLSNIKLPGLQSGCSALAVHRTDKSGLLAVCIEGHTINIYLFDDKMIENSRETVQCQRPFKILFSAVPVDAMVFVKQATLALASSSNRTLTIWTGVEESIC